MDFAIPVDHKVEIKESDKINIAWELKNAVEHESDGDTNWNWPTWNNL